jgi:pSer/pThr/pTyr-binding forkhead associated (FHA) protein
VLPSALFCGNCGFNLKGVNKINMPPENEMSMPEFLPELNEINLSTATTSAFPAETADPAALTPPVQLVEPAKTQIQQLRAALLHVQTDTIVELPTHLNIIHIGKPNNVIPPDVDVSGFPDSDIVSRVHGDIRIEGGDFYLEDTGSSNGTYVNNQPLPVGNKHKLRAGDRVSLGKGDKVSFIFQML